MLPTQFHGRAGDRGSKPPARFWIRRHTWPDIRPRISHRVPHQAALDMAHQPIDAAMGRNSNV
jgi:hypothetical protein